MDRGGNYVKSSSNEGVLTDSSKADWYILTSLRSDPQLDDHPENTQYHMLSYHQQRMLDAANCFGWHKAEERLQGAKGLKVLAKALDTDASRSSNKGAMQVRKSYKIRVVVDRGGLFNVSASEVPAIKAANHFPSNLSALDFSLEALAWRVFVSPVRTVPTMFTRHKTTNRDVYDQVRKEIPSWAFDSNSLGNGNSSPEILLVNTQGDIMEGSITTPYFFRNGRWVTPPAASGGNVGTTRKWALEVGLCVEEFVRMQDVRIGENIWLSNAVKGWGRGIVTDRRQVQERNGGLEREL